MDGHCILDSWSSQVRPFAEGEDYETINEYCKERGYFGSLDRF